MPAQHSADTVNATLARSRLGVWPLVFTVMAAAAPLTVVAGGATTGFAVTGITGIPIAYVLVALGGPTVAALVAEFPAQAAGTAGGVAVFGAFRAQQIVQQRRFRAEYIDPTLAAILPSLGLQTGVTLHVDPSLGNLTPRLAKPLSPAEVVTRLFYGERIEPVLRWLPEHVQRGLWLIQRKARPVTSRLEAFRRPGETLGPRIELNVARPYLTSEQRQLVSAIIGSKIPVSDLVESWHQVGPKVRARWTVRKRPPAAVGTPTSWSTCRD